MTKALPELVPQLCILFAVSALPSAAAAGSSEKWWTEEAEYCFVEAVVLGILVILALIFEAIWHHIESHTDHFAYAYGELHDFAEDGQKVGQHRKRDSRGNVRHLRLSKELVRRTGGEFMSLGFLAFCVFTVNMSGGFKAVSKKFPSDAAGDDWHLPATSDDWLHLTEVVHISLFLGMVLYFFLMSLIVRGSVNQISRWEELRLRRLKHSQEREEDAALGRQDRAMKQFDDWRAYLLADVINWRNAQPRLFVSVLEKFDIDASSGDHLKVLEKDLEARFAFSAYLAFNVEEGVFDAIEVHTMTWLFILVVFVCLGLLYRYMKVGLINHVMPGIIGVAFIVLVCMRLVVRVMEDRIGQHASGRRGRWPTRTFSRRTDVAPMDDSGSTIRMGEVRLSETQKMNVYTYNFKNDWSFKHQWYVGMLRLLQAVLFLLSYLFGRILADFQYWKEDPEKALLYGLVFAFIFALLSHILPAQVPLFLALLSLPPKLDRAHVAKFFAAIDDHLTVEQLQEIEKPICEQAPKTGYGTSQVAKQAWEKSGNLMEIEAVRTETDTILGELASKRIVDEAGLPGREVLRCLKDLDTRLRRLEYGTPRAAYSRGLCIGRTPTGPISPMATPKASDKSERRMDFVNVHTPVEETPTPGGGDRLTPSFADTGGTLKESRKYLEDIPRADSQSMSMSTKGSRNLPPREFLEEV